MAGRRRRGVAAAGAANLLTELINRDMEFSRDSRRRAVELQQKLLIDQALQREKMVMEGKGSFNTQTGQWMPTAGVTPAIPSGLEPSGLSYDDPSGVKRSYARPLQEPRAQAQNPASLAGAMKTLQDIELMNREEQRQATPGSKGFLGMGRRPAYTPNVIDTGPLRQQLYGGVTQTASGAGGGGLPADLPQPTDPSLGDQSGNTEGAQVQSAEDGQVYEVRNGQWVPAQ